MSKLVDQNDTAMMIAFKRLAYSSISCIQTRDPEKKACFTHPLTVMKSATDVVVHFDGPDDPYRPVNWSFKKKAGTTILYGFTTMGMHKFHILRCKGISRSVTNLSWDS